jgi:type II secretory pathway pseudopilin PulG
LIEIAIVLAIIGLLLGGVLKGQELINNSKTRNAINDLNGVSAAYNAYIDRYRRLPGDDGPTATLTARGASWAPVVEGDMDGVLDVTASQTFSGGGENDDFFQHLKAAGFITGNPADTAQNALPRNAFGGLIGVTSAADGLAGRVAVCLGRVTGKGAQQMDTQLDDGLPNTGRVRGYTSNANNTQPNTVAPNYNEDNVFTVCAEI